MKKKIVSFQGIDGAYSDLVCRKFYRTYKTLPCETFQKTLDAVSKGVANLALIPVENNIAGRVADMHLLLEKIELKIVAEHYHKVEHHLMTKKDVSLKNINKVLKLEPVIYIDTAGAAKFVRDSQDSDISAIASMLASEIYELRILKKNLQDRRDNITRFLVFSKSSPKINMDRKVITSIVFNTKNIPASLYKALGGFAENSINLTRLESFFVNKDFKQFSFIIDVESHPDNGSFKKALKVLKSFSSKFRILGFYEASKFRK